MLNLNLTRHSFVKNKKEEIALCIASVSAPQAVFFAFFLKPGSIVSVVGLIAATVTLMSVVLGLYWSFAKNGQFSEKAESKHDQA